MPDDALLEIAKQAPYAAAFIGLTISYLLMIWKFIHLAVERIDAAEVRHARERELQEQRWLSRVSNIADDCHEAQGRASVAITNLAAAEAQVASSLAGMNAKMDILVREGR